MPFFRSLAKTRPPLLWVPEANFAPGRSSNVGFSASLLVKILIDLVQHYYLTKPDLFYEAKRVLNMISVNLVSLLE